MKHIKIILACILLSGTFNYLNAQENAMYEVIRKTVHKNENDSAFTSKKFYEKALFFTINMVVNQKGVIDSVVFSDEKNETLNRLFDFPKISRELKKHKTAFATHRNEILVLLVMISRGEYYFTSFSNGEEITNNLRKISSIQVKLKDLNKKQIFLSPLLISSRGGKYHDKF
ncbi:hypothetical protein D9M68_475010 [compost metagenome]